MDEGVGTEHSEVQTTNQPEDDEIIGLPQIVVRQQEEWSQAIL